MFVAAGPVSRILSAGLLRQDGHSSGPRITARLKRPTRRLWRAEPARAQGRSLRLPPYLVLLRVGFTLPIALLRWRCALTAPFHPYLDVATGAVCFLWHFPSTGLEPGFPDVIRHTALRSSDFPPAPSEDDTSDRPVRLPTPSLYGKQSLGVWRQTLDCGHRTSDRNSTEHDGFRPQAARRLITVSRGDLSQSQTVMSSPRD